MDERSTKTKEIQGDPSWLFCHNDLDLLEEEFFAVTASSDKSDQELVTIEEKILDDQEAEEERAQEVLEALLEDLPLSAPCAIHPTDIYHSPIKHLLSSPLDASPLASQAWCFLRPLALWAKQQTTHASIHEHLFRLRLHAPLIPAKLVFASHEEDHHDEASLVIAENELKLAQGYLENVLTSIAALGQAELLSQAEAHHIEAEGQHLYEALHSRLQQVRAGRRFRRPRE